MYVRLLVLHATSGSFIFRGSMPISIGKLTYAIILKGTQSLPMFECWLVESVQFEWCSSLP